LEEELDLYAIWQIIVKRWKLIVLLPVLATLASFLIYSHLSTPLYSSSTTMMVRGFDNASQIYMEDINISRQLVPTYREIIRSRRVLEAVIANSSMPYSAAQLRGKVDVQAVGNTELISIMVTDPDPVLARDIANELATTFMDQIVEIMQVENVSIIDQAVTPNVPNRTNIKRNVGVVLVISLMVAFGLAFLLEFLDQTIKEHEDAQKVLGIPVIGMTPRADGEGLFTRDDPHSPASEAFRTLWTNIQYSSIDKPLKKILITGANQACGKSTVSANLSVTIARSGKKVLLIEGDLRRPNVHNIFGLAGETGLSSIIFKEGIEINLAIHKTEQENLLILPSGPLPPYPAEFLASERMKRLVSFFAERFEYLIFDSPPVMAVTDAAIISRLVDGVLIVLYYGRVRRDEAKEALSSLARVQANVIGTVINAIPLNRSYYGSYNSYYRFEDSGRKGRRKKKG